MGFFRSETRFDVTGPIHLRRTSLQAAPCLTRSGVHCPEATPVRRSLARGCATANGRFAPASARSTSRLDPESSARVLVPAAPALSGRCAPVRGRMTQQSPLRAVPHRALASTSAAHLSVDQRPHQLDAPGCVHMTRSPALVPRPAGTPGAPIDGYRGACAPGQKAPTRGHRPCASTRRASAKQPATGRFLR